MLLPFSVKVIVFLFLCQKDGFLTLPYPCRCFPIPPQPEGCPDSVYALMQRCWAATPDQRPTFKEVRAELRDLFRHRSQRKGSCVVCCEAAATMVLMPCGHQSTCASHTEGLTVCPLCGTPVESAVRVFHA